MRCLRLGAFLHGFGRRLGALALLGSVAAHGSIEQRSTVRKGSRVIQVYLGIDEVTGRKRYRFEALRGGQGAATARVSGSGRVLGWSGGRAGDGEESALF